LLDVAESVAERLPETRRYTDPDLAPASAPHEIPAGAVARAAKLARDVLAEATADPTDWFGRFITRYRSAHVAVPAGKPIDAATLERALKRGRALHRSPWSRYAFVRDGRGARAFFAGDAWSVSLALARRIGAGHRLDAAAGAALSRADRDALVAMLNAGHWVLADD
jgi:50S ribosomal protein L16 3-hydroxylase